MEHKICGWVKQNDTQYVDYHNNEWGKPIHDDDELFELFSLETQSSGLSWLTVLKKRDGYREVFVYHKLLTLLTKLLYLKYL